MPHSSKEVRLRVAEARARDSGRKIARIDRSILAELGVNIGEFVEVEGEKGSAILQAWPAYPDDEGKRIIRIDGLIRESIGARVGDYVIVRRAVKVEPATRITLAPTEPIRFGADFPEYVKKYLVNKPLSRGEVVIIPIFGMGLKFNVIHTEPSTHVYVTEFTEIIVREKPIRKAAKEPTEGPLEIIESEIASKFAGLTPAREILESITADVLRTLGFNVQVNRRIRLKSGTEGEVDVYAFRRVGDIPFRIWVECKNWNRQVDLKEIQAFHDKIINSQESPHIAIFIAKDYTKPAKQEAISSGIFLISLGEKALSDNAEEIAKTIERNLRQIFTSISPAATYLEKAISILEEAKTLINKAIKTAK